jgi:hypothetical protein
MIQSISHYYRHVGTQRYSHSLDQLLHKTDHAASLLNTHSIFTDRYETRKIVEIELISE